MGMILAVRQDAGGADRIALSLRKVAKLLIPFGLGILKVVVVMGLLLCSSSPYSCTVMLVGVLLSLFNLFLADLIVYTDLVQA
jgi:hypothetical protein